MRSVHNVEVEGFSNPITLSSDENISASASGLHTIARPRNSSVETRKLEDASEFSCLKRLPYILKPWRRENWMKYIFILFSYKTYSCIAIFNEKDEETIQMAWIEGMTAGFWVTFGIMVANMNKVAADMVENHTRAVDCREMIISTFTNLSLISALLFTVLVTLLFLDIDYSQEDEKYKTIHCFTTIIGLVLMTTATIGSVVITTFVTPLNSEGAIEFMNVNGWAAGLFFQGMIAGVIWMFFSLYSAVRIKFGDANSQLVMSAPSFAIAMIAYIWRHGSKFQISEEARRNGQRK